MRPTPTCLRPLQSGAFSPSCSTHQTHGNQAKLSVWLKPSQGWHDAFGILAAGASKILGTLTVDASEQKSNAFSVESARIHVSQQ